MKIGHQSTFGSDSHTSKTWIPWPGSKCQCGEEGSTGKVKMAGGNWVTVGSKCREAMFGKSKNILREKEKRERRRSG